MSKRLRERQPITERPQNNQFEIPSEISYQVIPVRYLVIWIHGAFDILTEVVIVLSNDVRLIRDIQHFTLEFLIKLTY